jgi:hypothetical protein
MLTDIGDGSNRDLILIQCVWIDEMQGCRILHGPVRCGEIDRDREIELCPARDRRIHANSDSPSGDELEKGVLSVDGRTDHVDDAGIHVLLALLRQLLLVDQLQGHFTWQVAIPYRESDFTARDQIRDRRFAGSDEIVTVPECDSASSPQDSPAIVVVIETLDEKRPVSCIISQRESTH